MPYLRTEGILPNVIDRETPNECQFIKEWDIWEVYECVECGAIYYEDKPEKCTAKDCDSTEFHTVEQIMED